MNRRERSYRHDKLRMAIPLLLSEIRAGCKTREDLSAEERQLRIDGFSSAQSVW
jgi:hypothetical protein